MIDKLKVSGAVHPNSGTWANLRDLEALTKEFVMTPERLEKTKTFGAFGTRELNRFANRHPEFKNTQWFKKELALANQNEHIMENNGDNLNRTLRKVLKKGSYEFSPTVWTAIHENTPDDVLINVMERNNLWLSGVSFLQKNPELAKRVARMGLKRDTEKGFQLALTALQSIPPEEASTILEDSLHYWGSQAPPEITKKIEELKAAGTWNPAPVCHGIFTR